MSSNVFIQICLIVFIISGHSLIVFSCGSHIPCLTIRVSQMSIKWIFSSIFVLIHLGSYNKLLHTHTHTHSGLKQQFFFFHGSRYWMSKIKSWQIWYLVKRMAFSPCVLTRQKGRESSLGSLLHGHNSIHENFTFMM